MTTNTDSIKVNPWRKWIGVIWLLIELILLSANIFGFPALFKVLPNYGVYSSYCQSSVNGTEQDCSGQTQRYHVNFLRIFQILFILIFVFFRMH
jgi:hypothetical protein